MPLSWVDVDRVLRPGARLMGPPTEASCLRRSRTHHLDDYVGAGAQYAGGYGFEAVASTMKQSVGLPVHVSVGGESGLVDSISSQGRGAGLRLIGVLGQGAIDIWAV